jgi:Effector protein
MIDKTDQAKQNDLQQAAPKLKWSDVIKVNQKSFTDTEYKKIVESLEQIGNTTSGQTLFHALKNSNEKEGVVKIKGVNGESEYTPLNRTVRIEKNQITNMNIFHSDENGRKFKDDLPSLMFHELAHAVDSRILNKLLPENISLITESSGITGKHNLNMSVNNKKYFIEGSPEFMKTLTPEQLNALEKWQDLAKKDYRYSKNIELYKQFEAVLGTNPVIAEVMDLERKIIAKRLEGENPVIAATNVFNQERNKIYGTDMPNRADYFSSSYGKNTEEPPQNATVKPKTEAPAPAPTTHQNQLNIKDLNPYPPNGYIEEVKTDVPAEGKPISNQLIYGLTNLNLGIEATNVNQSTTFSPTQSPISSLETKEKQTSLAK